MSNIFPFPDKASSFEILTRDFVFRKIEKADVERVFDDAWRCGCEEARKFVRDHCTQCTVSMIEIFRSYGFVIRNYDYDYVVGHQRYFCEYTSRKNQISVYTKSVELWAKNNGFSYEAGLNLILAHEFYHYLEANEIGYTSRRYMVPMIRIGKIKIGKTGVPSLSEIAANAFANSCYKYFSKSCR